MIDYEEVLSNEQQDICFSNKNLLVKACPGSGKTRTITYKLAHRIEENPDKVPDEGTAVKTGDYTNIWQYAFTAIAAFIVTESVFGFKEWKRKR